MRYSYRHVGCSHGQVGSGPGLLGIDKSVAGAVPSAAASHRRTINRAGLKLSAANSLYSLHFYKSAKRDVPNPLPWQADRAITMRMPSSRFQNPLPWQGNPDICTLISGRLGFDIVVF